MRLTLRTLGLLLVLALGTAALARAQVTGGPSATGPNGSPEGVATTLDTLPPPATTSSTVATTTTLVPAIQSATTTSIVASTDPTLAPVCGLPAGGAGCRIIAYYGNPLSNRMGALGANPPQQMLPELISRTNKWRIADPATPTRCALELIAVAAQAAPGRNRTYRLRMSDKVINQVLGWARGAGCLLILDVQVGWSSVPEELPYLQPWLNEPDVHLALDPEWDMPTGIKPGAKVGTMSAAHIQFGIDLLTRTVADRRLGPKMLIVHRFRDFMVSNPESIVPNPSVRLVVNMDGFGPPETKLNSYRVALAGMPTTLTGFKLFFLNDKPLLGPKDVLPIIPAPVFINYQ